MTTHATGLDAARTPHHTPTLAPATAAAIASFVDWYDGNSRATYADHMRVLVDWCAAQAVDPLHVTRLQLEAFARHLVDTRGNSVGTVRRRMNCIARFYALTAADGIIPASPAIHVRLPRQYPDTDRATDVYLDRFQLAGMLAHARRGPAHEAALIALMGLMGLRVGEAISLDVDAFVDSIDGHRVLRFTGKGKKPATLPIPVFVLRLLEAAAAGRTAGPLIARPNGSPLSYRAAYRVVARVATAAGLDQHVTPHTLRRSFASAALDAGVSPRDVQTAGRWADSRMVAHYDKARHQLDRSGIYAVAAYIAGAS